MDVGEAAVDGRLTVGRGDSVTRTAGILWMLATSEAWSGLVDREAPVLDTIVLDFWLPWWVEILTLSVVTRSASEEILGGGTWHSLRCSASASALAAMRCEEYGAPGGRRAETQMRETRGGAWRNNDPGGLNTRYSRGEFTRPDCSVTYIQCSPPGSSRCGPLSGLAGQDFLLLPLHVLSALLPRKISLTLQRSFHSAQFFLPSLPFHPLLMSLTNSILTGWGVSMVPLPLS